jgi:putative endonuclease
MSSVSRGQKGEKLAEEYLLSQGYSVLAKNWRGIKGQRAPEIDIIAIDKDTIVFVEVKTASTAAYGSPEFWITETKRKRLITGAQAYMAQNLSELESCRFDAILIDNRVKPPLIRHVVNAFMADEF